MEARFSSPVQRWMFFCGVLAVAAALIIFSIKIVVADYYAAKSTPEGLGRAARLEPLNARYPYLLAHYWHYSLERGDLGQALASYHRALALDPHSAKIWMDLAEASEELGDLEQAREAYAAALQCYPASADVAWRYGNFLIRHGDFANALTSIHRAVKGDRTLASAAISTYWRANPDVEVILDQGLPPLRSVYLDAIQYFTKGRSADAALAVWKRLIQTKGKLDLSPGLALIDVLVEQDRISEAKKVWQDALESAGVVNPSEVYGSLVWDGGFEGDFIDGGFGWTHKIEEPGIRYAFDQETKHSGARSLRVMFDGSGNFDFRDLVQRVPVLPNTTYELSAYLRTDGITTNNGLRLQVFDSDKAETTPQLTGTQPWTRVELSFATGAKTHLLTIALRRIRSEKIDNKLAGTVWIDDVSLKPAAEKKPSR